MPEITDADQKKAGEIVRNPMLASGEYLSGEVDGVADVVAPVVAAALADEREQFRPFCERIQQAAMDRGGFDQGVEVDSATFVVQALEAAEAARDDRDHKLCQARTDRVSEQRSALQAQNANEVRARLAAEAERDEYKEQAEAADTGHKNAVEALDQNWVTHQEVVASRKRAEQAEAERDSLRAALAAYPGRAGITEQQHNEWVFRKDAALAGKGGA